METRGRKKKTQEQKRLEGSFRADRDGRSTVANMKMPEPPSWIDADELRIWNEHAKRLNMSGILSFDDAESFGLFCFWMNKFIKLKESESDSLVNYSRCCKMIDKYGAKFGYTPADRASLKIEKPEKEDPLEAILSRKNIKIK